MLAIISWVSFLDQLRRKTHLFTPLYASFSVLVLLILGQEGLNLSIELIKSRTADLVSHTLLVERQGENLLHALIDESSSSLEAETKAQRAFHSSFNRLYNLLQDNPSQLKLLDRIKYLHDSWQRELNQRAISDASRYTLASKTLFDSLLTQVLLLLEREEILLDEGKQRLKSIIPYKHGCKHFRQRDRLGRSRLEPPALASTSLGSPTQVDGSRQSSDLLFVCRRKRSDG